MDLVDDPNFKIKYQKNKLRVKRWETDFMEKYGRRPNKNDIRAADNTIKESYKMYWKLKTQALEETLLDITFSDEVQANVTANTSGVSLGTEATTGRTEESPNVDKNLLESGLRNLENINPEKCAEPSTASSKEGFSAAVPPEETPNVDGAWGAHLNKDNEPEKPEKVVKKKNLIIGRSSSFQLSQKLFSSSSLTLRNPRKSLSSHKLKSNKSDANLKALAATAASGEKSDGFDLEKSIFGEFVKVVNEDTKIMSQPINAIHQLIKGETSLTKRKLNHGWLERCSKENNLEPILYNPQRLSGTSDSGVESMDTSDPAQLETLAVRVTEKPADSGSDEDFICNSDSEEERRSKRVRNFKKRLSDGACQQLAKRQCLDTEDTAFSFSQPFPSKPLVVQSPPTIPQESSKPPAKMPEIPIKIDDIKNEKIVKTKSPAVALSPDDKKYELPADKLESESEEEEETSARKKKARKTTRVTRSTRGKAKSGDARELTKAKKKATAAPRKRATRKTAKKTEEPSDDELTAETGETPNIPIYGVEAMQVVPRFALPTNASGDLVSDFSQSVASSSATTEQGASGPKPRGKLTDREKLEAKVASGKVNENFVRINLKKKVFVRGKKNFNFSKYRKNQWKQRKKDLASGEAGLDLADFVEKIGSNTCFKCGGTGHYSRRCTAMKSDELLPNDGEEPSSFPTLEEVEKMANENAVLAHAKRIERLPKKPSFSQAKAPTAKTSNIGEGADVGEDNNDDDDVDEDYEDLLDGADFDEEFENPEESVSPRKLQGHKIPEDLLAKLLPPETGQIEPVYPGLTGKPTNETPAEVFEALKMFGHEKFRPGQEKAVMRILSGQSTLVTLSTGSGKSLCYQLPAYIFAKHSRCITLVVSPLVSLMDDQVVGVPKFLSAAALHTGQTPKVKDQIMEMIREGKLDILLVSPEAVVAGEKSTGFGALLRQLPPIAFACIDEAHCISQWSHNFRPSYLMICRVLTEKLGVKTILGLTATATKSTAESIVKHLSIPDGMSGVISDVPMPKNLTLTVSKDEQRDRALVELLLSERFKECDSIIVYCTRREECTRIAGVIRVSLQDPRKQELTKAKCSPIAEAYHAGLTASRRKVIQKSFMRGETRVVVATVAFGMGINKANIRSVVHYNMPASFEGYVQEVGRAGRDNLPAHCHLFLAPSKDGDKLELRRHIFANGVDRHMIRRLLQRIFVPCSCPRVENRTNEQRCPGHEVAIPVDETVRALDISEETIATLLCYLELHPKRFVTVLSSVYVNAKVSSYAGPKAIKIAAQSSPPLAMAIALDLKNGISHDDSSMVEFPVVDIAAAIGWDSGVVKSHLKNLEWQTTADGKSKRSAISVRYDTLGLRVRAPGDLTDAELDEALEALASRAQTQESSALRQLETIHASLSKFSHPNVRLCMELTEDNTSKSESLKEIIREYFRSDDPLSIIEIEPQKSMANEAEIVGDVRSLLCSYRDNNFTGRAVARIFHGIQSPNFPAVAWSRCRFWRAHLSTDFNWICRIATREILAMR